MLVANEGKCVLSEGEVTAVRNVRLPTFPNWEGTVASQEGGSQLPEVSAEQVDRPEQRRFVRVTVCGQRAFRDFYLFIMSLLQSALISHSHVIFKKNLLLILPLKFIGWIIIRPTMENLKTVSLHHWSLVALYIT